MEAARDWEIRTAFRALSDEEKGRALRSWKDDGYGPGLKALLRDPVRLDPFIPPMFMDSRFEEWVYETIDPERFRAIEQLTRYLNSFTEFLPAARTYVINRTQMSPAAFAQAQDDERMRKRLIVSVQSGAS